MTRITGSALISMVDTLTAEGKTRSEICRAAGYTSIKQDGNERLHFTDFYTMLIEAKGGPETLNNQDQDQDEWDYTHPEVAEEYMQEYNDLCEQYSQQAVDFFLTSWSDVDLEDFRDYYVGYYESEADFAKAWYEDLNISFSHKIWPSIPVQIVVDWQATWDVNLQHYFYFMSGYVFRN